MRYAATKLIDEFGEPVTHARGVETAKVMVMFSSLLTLIISFAYFIMIVGRFRFRACRSFSSSAGWRLWLVKRTR